MIGGVTAERTTNDGDINTFYAYPRYSASYRVPQIVPFLNDLKLRAAYGQSGTQPLYGVRYTPLTTNLISQLPGLAGDTLLGDLHIKPETETEIEIGFDATMLASRAQFSATVYQKRVTNLLLQAGVDPTQGFDAEWLNGGQFTNQGVELSLSARPLQLRNSLGWSTTLSFYRNYGVVNSCLLRGFQIPHSGGGGVGASWEQPGRCGVGDREHRAGRRGRRADAGRGWPAVLHQQASNNDLTFAQFRLSGLLDWSRGGNVQDISATDYDFGPGLWGDSARSAERAAAFVAGFAPYVEASDVRQAAPDSRELYRRQSVGERTQSAAAGSPALGCR